MLHSFARPLASTLVLSLVGGNAASQGAGATVDFVCAYPAAITCYFSLFTGLNQQNRANFSVKGQNKSTSSGITLNQNTYCVNTTGPNPADCPQKVIQTTRVVAKP